MMKVSRLLHPVVATNTKDKAAEKRTCDDGEDIEHVIRKAFQHVHVSFKSKSSCTLSTVNALNGCKMSAMIRSRGQFGNRRNWVIEMNKARHLYIVT